MAQNLSGMFNQINQAIRENPLGKQHNFGVPGMTPRSMDTINPMLQRGIKGMAGAMGMPADMRTSQQAMGDMSKAMSGLDLQTPEGLTQAATLYGSVGMVDKQLAMTQAAQEEQLRLDTRAKELKAQGSLADRAEAQDMTDLAETIRTGAHPDLKEAAKTIEKEERRKILFDRGEPGRRVMARQAGFTMEEYEKDLKDLTNEELLQVLDGETGTIKAFTDAQGKSIMLATDKHGRVWKDGTRYRPEDLQLQQAVQKTQEVVSAADKLVQAATDLAIDNFKQLQEGAVDAAKTLEVTDRALSLLGQGTATGFFSGAEIALGRIASELGIAPEWAKKAQNAQAYIATMGNQVATIIKAFGSGTGLSDQDRKYAEKIAGGDVAVDEVTLRWLLEAQRTAARNIRAKHSEILGTLNKQGMDTSTFALLEIAARPMNTVPSGSGSGRWEDLPSGN